MWGESGFDLSGLSGNGVSGNGVSGNGADDVVRARVQTTDAAAHAAAPGRQHDDAWRVLVRRYIAAAVHPAFC